MARDNLWMPLCVADYLADTMHLTTVQHGAYMLLLMHYWRNGPLPNDAKQLAMIARADGKAWGKDIWPVVGDFFRLQDGRLHQKRADAELARAEDKSGKRRAAAEARWRGNGHDDNPPPTDANADANASPNADANGHANDHANGMQTGCTRASALHHTTPEVRKKDGGTSVPPYARATPLSRFGLLPENWEPEAKSRLLASDLGFDQSRLDRLANSFRGFCSDKKITSRDWEERFCLWLNEAKSRDRDTDALAKSQHQKIREDMGGGTFLIPGVPYEDTIPEPNGVRLTAIAGGRK
jgi:uncharacterized protein YdaU (DUF1376 family)